MAKTAWAKYKLRMAKQFLLIICNAVLLGWLLAWDGIHEAEICAAAHPEASYCDSSGPAGVIVGFILALMIIVLGSLVIFVRSAFVRERLEAADKRLELLADSAKADK